MGELEREVSRAEGRDRVALGDALVDQRRPPKPEADTARQLLEEAKREAEALAYAEQRAASALDQLPKQHREEWLGRAAGDLGKARDAYRAAVFELARARDQLADEATLVSYLEFGQQTQPIPAALKQRLSDGSVRAHDFSQLIELMLAEAGGAEDAARLDPARPQPQPQWHRVHTSR